MHTYIHTFLSARESFGIEKQPEKDLSLSLDKNVYTQHTVSSPQITMQLGYFPNVVRNGCSVPATLAYGVAPSRTARANTMFSGGGRPNLGIF